MYVWSKSDQEEEAPYRHLQQAKRWETTHIEPSKLMLSMYDFRVYIFSSWEAVTISIRKQNSAIGEVEHTVKDHGHL